jgi:hypothetical protein
VTRKSLQTLTADVRAEIGAIERSIADMAEARAAGAGVTPSRVTLWACGGTLHAFYTGIEKLLETIAVALDGAPPAGPDWRSCAR